MKQKSKLIAYSGVAIKTLMTTSSVIMGLMLMTLVGIGVGVYLHLTNTDIYYFFKNILPHVNKDSLFIIKITCVLIIFVMFSTVSGIMQTVVSDKDNNIVAQIIPLIHEKDYILGKVLAASVLAVSSLVNLIVCFVVSFLTVDILNSSKIYLWFYISKLFETLNIKYTIIFVGVLILEFLTLTLFTVLLSGRINKIQESATNTLIVLSPLLISIFILVLPISTNVIKNISFGAMFIPLFSVMFVAVNYSLVGMTVYTVFSMLLSIVYIYILYRANKKLYQYFLSSNKKFTLYNMIEILCVKNIERK